VQKRVIGILNAAPASLLFPDTVSGKQGRYPSTAEIQYAIFEADNALCRDTIMTGHPWRNSFMTVTDALTNNSQIDPHLGGQGIIEISDVDSDDDEDWFPAITPKSKDEVSKAIRYSDTVYGTQDSDVSGFGWIEDSRIFTTSPFARVRYPDFIPNNTTCQSNSALEDAVVAGAVSLLFKDGSTPDLLERYKSYFADCRAELRAGVEVFPLLEQADMAV